MMNLRNIVLWLFIALIVFGLFNLFSNTSGDRNTVDLTYSQFLDEVEAGSIKDVIIRGNNINGSGISFKRSTIFKSSIDIITADYNIFD